MKRRQFVRTFVSAVAAPKLLLAQDIFVPPIGSKPGALAAETPAFLDFFLAKSPENHKRMYQNGLNWLDAESKKQFAKPFAQLDPAQADRIVHPWMRTWMPDHPPTEEHAAFLNIALADIRTATINTKVWSDAPAAHAQEATPVGLYWFPIEPDIYRETQARTPSLLNSTTLPR